MNLQAQVEGSHLTARSHRLGLVFTVRKYVKVHRYVFMFTSSFKRGTAENGNTYMFSINIVTNGTRFCFFLFVSLKDKNFPKLSRILKEKRANFLDPQRGKSLNCISVLK